MIAEGDFTVARFTARMTHGGDGIGVKATGRRVTLGGMVMIRWEGGRIAEGWNEFDAAGLLRQITAGPAPGDAATGGAAMAVSRAKVRV